MKIGVLTIEFRLIGCRSLKEKRKRMGGLHNRFGRYPDLAVCESGYRNHHRMACWSFITAHLDGREIDRRFASLEEKIPLSVDARVIDIHREVF